MSTRPDYINDGIIEILKRYTVSQIELGIQSISDKVLSASKRGHTSQITREAVSLLVNNGFQVVGQMMIGLPSSTLEDELDTAAAICEMGCVASRIYPTVVFTDTELDSMYKSLEYTPLDLDDAVERSAAALGVFIKNGVDCIRIGLCDSDNLHSSDTYSAGPNHSALGELVISRYYYNVISDSLENYFDKKNSDGYTDDLYNELSSSCVEVCCSKGSVSKIVGNKKENKNKICEKFGIKCVKAVENNGLLGYNITIKVNGEVI